MQSFSPLYTFEDCAKVLDMRRLHKNALEAYQCLNIIRGKTNSKGFANHPVVKMWAKNPNSYVEYALSCVSEWKSRGYKSSLEEKLKSHYVAGETNEKPKWWGREEFHSSHRGTLKFKNLDHYSKFGWTEFPVYNYWWPTQNGY